MLFALGSRRGEGCGGHGFAQRVDDVLVRVPVTCSPEIRWQTWCRRCSRPASSMQPPVCSMSSHAGGWLQVCSTTLSPLPPPLHSPCCHRRAPMAAIGHVLPCGVRCPQIRSEPACGGRRWRGYVVGDIAVWRLACGAGNGVEASAQASSVVAPPSLVVARCLSGRWQRARAQSAGGLSLRRLRWRLPSSPCGQELLLAAWSLLFANVVHTYFVDLGHLSIDSHIRLLRRHILR
jgi:hypothetical protein